MDIRHGEQHISEALKRLLEQAKENVTTYPHDYTFEDAYCCDHCKGKVCGNAACPKRPKVTC